MCSREKTVFLDLVGVPVGSPVDEPFLRVNGVSAGLRLVDEPFLRDNGVAAARLRFGVSPR